MRRRRALLLPLLLLAACSDPVPPAAPVAPVEPAAPVAPTADTTPAPTAAALPPAAGELGTLATAQDTLEKLRDRHGAANVSEAPLPLGEGFEEPGWVLFADEPARRVLVYLDSLEQPTHLRVEGSRSDWSVHGVRLGMPLPEVQAINGGPLAITGFGWDYGGRVIDWQGGSLDGLGVTADLCLPDDETPADYPMGEAPFASDDPRVATLVPTVCTVGQQVGPSADR